MEMGFRWYGNNNDTVTLQQIKQIPGVKQIVWALHYKAAGEVWTKEEIQKETDVIKSNGFDCKVVESVNIHEDIKLGLPSRDTYIQNYKETIKNLSEAGVEVICYNFMPVFDWIRTDLHKEMSDGSTALFYENNLVNNIEPEELINRVLSNPEFTMPGWEPERMAEIQSTLKQYENVTKEDLFDNLRYFLEQVGPACKEAGIKLAIHPDDPPWELFGLPKVASTHEDFQKVVRLVEEDYSGITLCSGALGARGDNDIPAMIREFKDYIHFAHVRNVYRYENGDFIETSHRAQDGSVDIVEVMNAYHDINFQGCIRPDHGRHIWEEECRPGYGLYDRALGIMYMLGIWDQLKKGEES